MSSPPAAPPQPVEWGPGKTPQGRARLPSSRRRDKPLLSCNHCRQRKLRCDRQLPCGSCTKRALGASCAYSSNMQTSAAASGDGKPHAPASHPGQSVQDRIKHLETLLLTLMQSQQNSSSATNNDPKQLAASAESGILPATASGPTSTSTSPVQDSADTSYITSPHWVAVLDEIAELKGQLSDEEQGPDDSYLSNDDTPFPSAGPQLFSGGLTLPSKQEILGSVPVRAVADQLISCYFNSFEMSSAVLHSVEFLKEYEAFWERPFDQPIAWIGLLFTLLCLATEFQRHQLDPVPKTPETMATDEELQRTVQHFRQRIVQCLHLADFTKGGPFILETLVLYMAIEFFLSSDAQMGICILLGTIVQLAMHMGYQREPEHFKDMSPFTREMRRRVWETIVALDLGVSMQMGLPRLIKPWQSDVVEPRNLQDRDFGRSTAELPQSRPETDVTPMLYRLARSRIAKVVGTVWDFATDRRPHRHEDVLKMDQALKEAHAAVPSCFKWDALLLADSPQVIMQKVVLEVLILRSTIVLHRRYLTGRPVDAEQRESRHKCLSAALNILEHQHQIQQKTEPFGQLYHERWRVSSLIKHDFLLATSILCSYLKHVQDDARDEVPRDGMTTAIHEALRKSYDIWLKSSSSSKEAHKVSKALSVVLGIDAASTPSGTTTSSSEPAQSYASPPNFNFNFPEGLNAFDPRFFAGDAMWTGWPQTEFDVIPPPFPVPVSGVEAKIMNAGMDPNQVNWYN